MKRHIKLNKKQRIELNKLLRDETLVKIHRRLQFIDMKDQGMKNTEIIKFIHITQGTCTDWTTVFLEKGFSWLCHLNYEWRRPWKLTPYKEDIEKYVEENIVSTVNELKYWLEKNKAVIVQTSWLWEFLKKNWICLLKKWRNSHESIKQ